MLNKHHYFCFYFWIQWTIHVLQICWRTDQPINFVFKKNYKKIDKYKSDQIWSILINFDQIWSNLIKTCFWSNLIRFDQIWSDLIRFDQIWSGLYFLIVFLKKYLSSGFVQNWNQQVYVVVIFLLAFAWVEIKGNV